MWARSMASDGVGVSLGDDESALELTVLLGLLGRVTSTSD